MKKFIRIDRKIESFNKKINVEGDKSLSIRWVIISSLSDGSDNEAISSKINTDYDKIINEISENSNIQIITKNKDEQDIQEIMDELIQDHQEQSYLLKIESLEQKLINNLDENSYSELIKLKSQLNRE